MFDLDNPAERERFARTAPVVEVRPVSEPAPRTTPVQLLDRGKKGFTCVKCFNHWATWDQFSSHYCPNATSQQNHRCVMDWLD